MYNFGDDIAQVSKSRMYAYSYPKNCQIILLQTYLIAKTPPKGDSGPLVQLVECVPPMKDTR